MEPHSTHPPSEHLIGTSPAMQELHRNLSRVSENDLAVAFEGEAGAGKEIAARALHFLSKRSGPFVVVNAASLADAETELFESARGGTLFFDGLGDMPLAVQAKLLSFLKDHPVPMARIISSTSRALMPRVRKGEFLEELYYRLHVVPLYIPPLRERLEDIAPLAQFFLKQGEAKNHLPKILDSETIAAMEAYDWPGNVRELQNIIYRLSALHGESIIGKDVFLTEIEPMLSTNQQATLQKSVETHLKHYFAAHSDSSLPPPGLYDRILPLIERPLIEMTLKATGGNQVKAAHVLGLNRNTLRKKIAELGIQVESIR